MARQMGCEEKVWVSDLVVLPVPQPRCRATAGSPWWRVDPDGWSPGHPPLFVVRLPFLLALFRETCAGGTWLQQLDKVLKNIGFKIRFLFPFPGLAFSRNASGGGRIRKKKEGTKEREQV